MSGKAASAARKIVPWLLCFGSGALFSVPYFLESLFFLSFLSPALFFFTAEKSLKGKEYRACLLFFLGFYFPLYSFLSALHPLTAAGFSDGQSLAAVVAACVLVPSVHAALSALVLQLFRFLPEGPLFRAFGTASLWVVHEWLCTLGDLAFPWSTAALSQTGFLPFLQTASFFGPAGIAFALISIGCLIGRMFAGRGLLRPLTAAGTVFTICLVSGLIVLYAPGTDGKTVTAAVIQGNASTEEKWDTEEKANVLKTYLDMAESAAEANPDLDWILLPESAAPANYEENGPLHDLYAGIASKYGVTVVAGVLQTDENGVHNALVAVTPDGRTAGPYEKQKLVPFGEKIPFGGVLNRLFPSLGQFGLGGTALTSNETEPVLEISGTEVGCYICFDSVFPSPERGGAEVCVVLTNDSWFDRSDAMLEQHLRFARLRAAETGKSVIRAANTGISAFIDSNGRVTARTEKKTPAVLTGTVDTNGGRTLYSRVGNVLVPVCAGLAFLLMLGRLLFRIRRR